MEVLKEFREGTSDAPPEDVVIDAKADKLELQELPEKPDGASQKQAPQASQQDSSVYVMACDESLMSKDVQRWMEGSVTPTQTTAVQGSKPTVMQRSALATDVTPGNGLAMYILALVMPIMNVVHPKHWRRTHEAVKEALDLCFVRMRLACIQARCHIRRAAHSQLTREILATAIDVVLVVYAIGFLILSIYQAAIYVY